MAEKSKAELEASGKHGIKAIISTLEILVEDEEEVENVEVTIDFPDEEEEEQKALPSGSPNLEAVADGSGVKVTPGTQKSTVLSLLADGEERTSVEVGEELPEIGKGTSSTVLGSLFKENFVDREEIEDPGHGAPQYRYEINSLGLQALAQGVRDIEMQA